MSWRDVPGDSDDDAAPGLYDATESDDDAVADPTGARLAVTLENLDAVREMLRAQPPTELEIDFEGYICLDEYNAKYAEKLERPRAEAAGAASEAWVLGDSLARLRDAMLPRLTRVSLAGADRLPVAMLRVAFPLDGDGLAAPAPYDDGSGSLLSIDFAPGSPARDGIESGDLGNYAPSMWTADHSARGLRGGKSTVRERFLRLWNFFPAAARVRMDVQRWNAKGACDADLHDLAKLFLCDLDERSVEVVGVWAHDGWYKNDVLVLDDGWASVGPEGIMQYPLGPERHNAGPHVKREQVHGGAADDDVPEPAVGVRVMAPWKNRHMYPGRVGAVSKSKDEVKINFDDGDELVVPWAACRLRDAPRPTFF